MAVEGGVEGVARREGVSESPLWVGILLLASFLAGMSAGLLIGG